MSDMQINKKKIKAEMDRQGLTLAALGKKFKPVRSRQNVWHMITYASTLSSIGRIATALGYDDPRDLIK